jgi:mRNA interferase MazF
LQKNGTVRKMQSTTPYRRTSVVLVPFPFTNQRTSRFRPALVVSSDAYNQSTSDVIVAMITGSIQSPPRVGDHLIQDWQGAGLQMPSRVRAKFATLQHSRVRQTLGQMPSADMTAVEGNLRRVLQL